MPPLSPQGLPCGPSLAHRLAWTLASVSSLVGAGALAQAQPAGLRMSLEVNWPPADAAAMPTGAAPSLTASPAPHAVAPAVGAGGRASQGRSARAAGASASNGLPGVVRASERMSERASQRPSARNWEQGRFVYRAEGKRLTDVLQDFAASQGAPAVVADGVEGMVNANFDARPRDFLDGISRAYNLLWYHDGTALYFYPGRAVQSRLFRLKGFRRDQVSGLLQSLDLGDKRYPIRYDEANSTLYVSGPPRHVELISAALDALDAGVSEAASRTVRVFGLQFAAAADRQLGEVSVPGVASTLRKLYGVDAANGTGAAASDAVERIEKMISKKASAVVPMPSSAQFLPPLPRANAKDGPVPGVQPKPSGKNANDGDEVPPRFEADEASNAVIVQGRADRMDEYEALIRRLDQKPRLVELEATIIEVNSDSVDALGVNWSFTGPKGSISLTAPNTVTQGAANAFSLGTVITDAGRELMARVNALKGEGKARVLSKPSVLGVANRAAVMREKRVATVRVSGNLEANLFQVEAGTLLEMTPQVTEADGGNAIKLSLYIEDGSFETNQVDQVPIIKKTEIRTEAYVREGESLLIGGITVESDQSQNNSVPGLSRLPLVGGIFRSTERQVQRMERLFLITPRLLGADNRRSAVAAASLPTTLMTQEVRTP